MRIAGFRPTSLFDGEGINAVVFVQGCRHGCKGCQNPSTWDVHGGYGVSVAEVEARMAPYLPLITGVTFSGGEPVDQYEEVVEIALWARKRGLHVTLYTGYALDEVRERALRAWACENGLPDTMLAEEKSLMDLQRTAEMDAEFLPFDFIIDGPFDAARKSAECAFRGSSNQHIWEKFGTGYQMVDYDADGKKEFYF